MFTKGLSTSATDEWGTPQEYFVQWDSIFHFDLDPCATHENAKCRRYYTKAEDGLSKDWSGNVWMNPPYGRQIGQWMKKAYETAHTGGGTVVCLVPARTDTKWWHDWATKGEIHFLQGRLKFGGAAHTAPFPSAVIIYYKGMC